jgi:hypothetical protein
MAKPEKKFASLTWKFKKYLTGIMSGRKNITPQK